MSRTVAEEGHMVAVVARRRVVVRKIVHRRVVHTAVHMIASHVVQVVHIHRHIQLRPRGPGYKDCTTL